MDSIDQQLSELRQKAAAYDNLLRLLNEHAEGLVAFADKLKPLVGIHTRKRSNGVEFEMLQEIYKKLVNGEKVSYTIREVEAALKIDKGEYAFRKLCEMEGIEKVREGKNVKAIFHFKN